jgi:hypothetical protein
MIIEGITWLAALAVNMVLFYVVYQTIRIEDPWRELLQYLFVLSLLIFAFFIPAIVASATKQCEVVVANSTSVDNVTITYGYTNYCYDTGTFIGVTFYQVFSYIWYIIVVTIMLWPVFKLLKLAMRNWKVRK